MLAINILVEWEGRISLPLWKTAMAKTRGKAAATPISKKKENPILESQQMILIKQLESLLNALNANKSDGIDTQTGVDSSIENLILSHSEVQIGIFMQFACLVSGQRCTKRRIIQYYGASA